MPFGSVGTMFSQMEEGTQIEKVIILKGAENRGKTKTLQILVNLLIGNGAKIIHTNGYYPDNRRDWFVILDIAGFGKVGIITYGDKGSEAEVQKALNECLKHKCLAVIGASHTQYYKTPPTVYKILWDFGHNQKAKTVETTTVIKWDGWGLHIDETHLNTICAENLINLLFKL